MFRRQYLMAIAVILAGLLIQHSNLYLKETMAAESADLVGKHCDILIKKQYPLLTNNALKDSLQNIVRDLTKHSSMSAQIPSVEVLNDPIPNIFSFPNRIYITTGLLDILNSKNELALLLAKEVAYLNDNTHVDFYQVQKSKRKISRWVTSGVSVLLVFGGGLAGNFINWGNTGMAFSAGTALTAQAVNLGFVSLSAVVCRMGNEVVNDYDEALVVETVFENQIAGLKRQAILAKHQGRYDAFKRLTDNAERLTEEREEYIRNMRLKNPRYASLRFPQPVMPAQVPIRPDEYLLRYKVTDASLLIWLLKNGTLLHSETVHLKRDVLKEKVQRYVDAFKHVENTPDLARFDMKLSNELYRILFAPVADKIPNSAHLIIVPDDILEVLPFESLIVQLKPESKMVSGKHGPYPEGVEYLADCKHISYYYSATFLRLTRESAKNSKPSKSVFMMADPTDREKPQGFARAKTQDELLLQAKNEGWGDDMQSLFDPLPHTRELTNRIKALYPDGRFMVGTDANKDNLAGIENHKYVVFATHGILANGLPHLLEPALLLSSGKAAGNETWWQKHFLTMSEVMKLDLSCENATLSACTTGLGRSAKGEGVMSMGWAFQYAGAKSVLVSLWSVDESSTVLLTGRYFENLKKGMDKMAALNDARSELRQKGYDHPFYWAPFILIGEII